MSRLEEQDRIMQIERMKDAQARAKVAATAPDWLTSRVSDITQAGAETFDGDEIDKTAFAIINARPNEIADAIGYFLGSERWEDIYEGLLEKGFEYELQLATFKEELEGLRQPPPYKKTRVTGKKPWR